MLGEAIKVKACDFHERKNGLVLESGASAFGLEGEITAAGVAGIEAVNRPVESRKCPLDCKVHEPALQRYLGD